MIYRFGRTSFVEFLLLGKAMWWLEYRASVPNCNTCVGGNVVKVIAVSGRMTLRAEESQSISST